MLHSTRSHSLASLPRCRQIPQNFPPFSDPIALPGHDNERMLVADCSSNDSPEFYVDSRAELSNGRPLWVMDRQCYCCSSALKWKWWWRWGGFWLFGFLAISHTDDRRNENLASTSDSIHDMMPCTIGSRPDLCPTTTTVTQHNTAQHHFVAVFNFLASSDSPLRRRLHATGRQYLPI